LAIFLWADTIRGEGGTGAGPSWARREKKRK
jgi:hypothetical protein